MRPYTHSTPIAEADARLEAIQDTLAAFAVTFAHLAAGYESGRSYTTIALCLREAVTQVHGAREELAALR